MYHAMPCWVDVWQTSPSHVGTRLSSMWTGTTAAVRCSLVSRLACFVLAALQPPSRSSPCPCRYFAHTLDALVDEPYVVVWLHTGSSYWNNCPSLAWLWRTYER